MIQECQQDIIIRESGSEASRQWARYHGWTIEILAALENSGGLTVPQLADKLNHRKRDIKEYCYRLRDSGFIEKVQRWGWKITSAGQQLLVINNGNTKATTRQQQGNTKATPRQLTLAPYSDPEYSEPELAITNLIISHYNKTGQPFLFIEDEIQICELAAITPEQLYESMRKLYQERVCYIYNNRKYGRQQLRLYKDFLERVKYA